jgi:hypothetical protein
MRSGGAGLLSAQPSRSYVSQAETWLVCTQWLGFEVGMMSLLCQLLSWMLGLEGN